MAEKFELASQAWFDEIFRLFTEVARRHPHVKFSVCEVFTNVPARLNPDAEGKIAWYGYLENGKADLHMGEVEPSAVDVKNIADWESTVPLARAHIDLTTPEGIAAYTKMTEDAFASGKLQRFGDRTKVPMELIGIHNAIAAKTA